MTRTCNFCSTTYEAKRSSSKFCSGLCRSRARFTETMPNVAMQAGGALEATTLAELTAAGVHESVEASCALLLARRIDAGDGFTLSGLAATVREFRTTYKAAMVKAPPPDSPLEVIRRRRAARMAEFVPDSDPIVGDSE